jgi:hypothetical protein
MEATMKRISKIRIPILATVIMLMFSMSWAAGAVRTFDLQSVDKHPDATGSVVIDKEHLSLQARGLMPDAAYTVWFVNMKPKKSEAGVGTAPYKFQTDKWGNGSYSAPLNESPFGKWASILVVLHPDGDPMNMKNMVGALKTEL